MATTTASVPLDNSTLANFKLWGQAIGGASGAFPTLGWTQTADTGQVNWGTIVAVPSSAFVYEVWKAADALASTMPIFVKVEYGFSSTVPRIQMTVGTNSNGSGSITGQVAGPFNICGGSYANLGSGNLPCYFSGSTGEFRMYMWAATTPNTGVSTGQQVVFGIERSKDATGANTATYVTTFFLNNNNTTATSGGQQSFSASANGFPDTGIVCLAITNGSASGLVFGNVPAYPVFPNIGQCGNPMLGLMTTYDGNVSDQSTATVTSLYGSSHTFLSFRGADFSACLGGRQTSVTRATDSGLLRYE